MLKNILIPLESHPCLFYLPKKSFFSPDQQHYRYAAPAHTHCFSYVKVAHVSATPAQDGGSRGKVSLERVYRLTLTLGLHFSKCVCVHDYSCPARHFRECLHFRRGLYLPQARGLPGWVYTARMSARTHTHTRRHTHCVAVWASHKKCKGWVLSYAHPSPLCSGWSAAAALSLRAQTLQK